MDARLRHLLDRALDGELTPLEHAELTRLRARCPEARREAAAWDRMRAGLTATLDQAPPLDLDRLARKIERDVRQQRSRRPLVAAASLVVLGALAAAGATDGLREVERTSAAAGAHARAELQVARVVGPPVEVRVEESSEGGGLVQIEF